MTTLIARLAVAAGVLLAMAGCALLGSAQPPEFPDGTSVHTIDVGGLDRSYLVHKPAGLPATAPLVVMLHGGFGTAAHAENRYGWDELADSAGFVVGYPDGLARSWNTNGGCCGRSAEKGVDDVGFITSVVGEISRGVGIDPSRVYATGISNGGMMAYTLACDTGIFAAIGPVAATQLDPCPAPHPTSVLHIHGTADQSIRYDGGRGAGVAHVDGPPVPEVNAFWRNVDQCASPTSSVDGPLTTSTAGCPDNRTVQLITIDGGDHAWPEFATPTLWQFFVARPH